jgi:hypothetical protein
MAHYSTFQLLLLLFITTKKIFITYVKEKKRELKNTKTLWSEKKSALLSGEVHF